MAEVQQDGGDALDPPEIAQKAVAEGVKSASLSPARMLVMGLLAGAFIAFGGLFATTVAAGTGFLPYGATQFLSGMVFTVGLAMVVVGGSELFTGNTMTVPLAVIQREVTGAKLWANWGIVFVGNFIGSLAVAALVLLSGQYTGGEGAVGAESLATADAKAGLTFVEALASGILANFLVCMAVWLAHSGRSTADKIIGLFLPIWAFVAADLEHSVANMYLVPIGLFIRDAAPDSFWSAIEATPADYPNLTWDAFLLNNLLPATIGNAIAGALLVGLAYWFIFLRD